MITQVAPGALIGVMLDRPDPTTVPLGFTFYDATLNVLYERTLAGWTIIGGSGGAISKYWVNVAGQQPFAPYNSIQAANDAAIADGHGPLHPAAIFLLPGTYIGDVHLSDGIILVGFSTPDISGNTIIVGNISATATTTCAIAQVYVQGRIIFGSGGATTAYKLRNVSVVPTIAGQVPLTLNDTTAQFKFQDCLFDGRVSGANAVEIAVALSSAEFQHCSLLAIPTRKSLHLSSTATVLSFTDCDLISGCDYAGAVTSALFDNCSFAMTAGHPVLTSFLGSLTTFHQCDATGLATGDQFVNGSGAILVDEFIGDNAVTIAPTITGNVLSVQRVYSQDTPLAGANVVLTSVADMERVAGPGGGVAFNCVLPSSKTIIQGIRTVIRNISSPAAVMTLKADPGTAGDNIDGAASITVVPPASSVIIQLFGQTWTSFSKQ